MSSILQVAAAHLDTVLDKLRRVLENQNQKGFRRCVLIWAICLASTESFSFCTKILLTYCGELAGKAYCWLFPCSRIIAVLFSHGSTTEVDDVCAALALMYGYAASYAPSTAIEARIETLVVSSVPIWKVMDVHVIPLYWALGTSTIVKGFVVLWLGLDYMFVSTIRRVSFTNHAWNVHNNIQATHVTWHF